MARPLKEGLDYFPFDVDFFMDIKIRRLSKACGPTSQSILICLLCNIYQDKGYYIEWNKDLPFLIADTVGVSEGAVEEVIKKAIQVKLFDGNIYERYNVLTSVGIQSRYILAAERRKKIDWISEYVLIDVVKNEVNDNKNEVNVHNNHVNDNRSTQSKVKESKVKESKVKDTKVSKKKTATPFTPPTLLEVQKYCLERENNVDPNKFIDFYQSKGWMIGKNKMKDWTAAVRTWEKSEKKGGNNGYKITTKPSELDESRKRKEEIAGQFARAVAECDN